MSFFPGTESTVRPGQVREKVHRLKRIPRWRRKPQDTTRNGTANTSQSTRINSRTKPQNGRYKSSTDPTQSHEDTKIKVWDREWIRMGTRIDTRLDRNEPQMDPPSPSLRRDELRLRR